MLGLNMLQVIPITFFKDALLLWRVFFSTSSNYEDFENTSRRSAVTCVCTFFKTLSGGHLQSILIVIHLQILWATLGLLAKDVNNHRSTISSCIFAFFKSLISWSKLPPPSFLQSLYPR